MYYMYCALYNCFFYFTVQTNKNLNMENHCQLLLAFEHIYCLIIEIHNPHYSQSHHLIFRLKET